MGRASRKKALRQAQGPEQGREKDHRPGISDPKEAVVDRPAFKAWSLAILLLLGAVTLLIYSNTFLTPFQFDDESNIIDNAEIRSLGNFLDFSGTRFVCFLTFALNYRFGGLNVFGYHLVNLLIHITNGFLVYSLILLLIRAVQGPPTPPASQSASAPFIALATALLFIAHPIQTQAVTYIVQRLASLVTLFYLLAVVGYLKWRLSPSEAGTRSLWYAVSLVSCVLAMKTKENSFTLPLMILLMERVFFKPLRWKAILPFFLLAAPIIPLSHQNALGEAEGFARDTTEIGRSDYLFTQFRVIVTYLRLLVLPINQRLDYDYPIYHSFFQPAVFIPFLFLLGLFVFAIRHIGRIGPIRLISFGILWFFLTLSIESSIIPIKDVIFEHRLYLPSVGFFLVISLLAARGWERWEKIRRLLAVSFFILIGGLATLTYQRNFVWKSKITLWRDAVAKAPQKPRAHYNLGLAYQEGGLFEEATLSYQSTLKFKPDYGDAYNNLGNIYKAQGSTDEAVKAYNQAFTVEPDHAEAHNNLGNIYTVQGRLEEAIRLYEKAIELKPTYAEAYNNLGIAYTTQGDLDLAIQVYQKGLSLQGDLDKTHFNLGNTYRKGGRVKEAIQEYQTAMTLRPDIPDYPYAVGDASIDDGQPEEAIRAYQTALRLKPDLVVAHYALGNAYAGQNRLKEAKQAYETALGIKPDFAEVYNNLGNIHTLEGRLEEAVRAYRKALELKPDYAEAARNLGLASKQLGRAKTR